MFLSRYKYSLYSLVHLSLNLADQTLHQVSHQPMSSLSWHAHPETLQCILQSFVLNPTYCRKFVNLRSTKNTIVLYKKKVKHSKTSILFIFKNLINFLFLTNHMTPPIPSPPMMLFPTTCCKKQWKMCWKKNIFILTENLQVWLCSCRIRYPLQLFLNNRGWFWI